MAISGSFYGTTGNSAIKPKISWSAQENVQGNYSDVTAKLSYSRTDNYTTYGHWSGSLTINGNKKSVSEKYVEITKNSNTLTITHTVRVYHNDDGTRTITISATGSIADTTLTKTTISGKVKLTNIPRAASIAAADADIGSVAVVTIGKKSDSYTYTVAYRFGNLAGYLSEAGISDTPVAVTAGCLAFPLPEAFYYEIPDKAADICTLTCTTWLEDTTIGEPQETTFTVRANPDRCGPILTVSAEDENPDTLQLTGDSKTFVRFVSDARCVLQAQGRYGAQILEKKIAGQTVTEDTLTIGTIDTDTVRFVVKDSRGFTREETLTLEMVPYFLPVVKLTADRTDATSGNVLLRAEGSFFDGDFGIECNDLQIGYQINGGDLISVTPEMEAGSFSLELLLQGMDYTQSHRIALSVTDLLNEVSVQTTVNPGIPVFDWGRSDFVFHVPIYYQGKRLEEHYVQKLGDSMEGTLSMGGHTVTDLCAPTADTDAATKAYTDSKISIRKLWENEKPTSTFAAQTVALDLSGYQWVAINCKYKTDNGQMKMSFARVGTQVGLDVITSAGYRGLRKADVSETGISFHTANYYAANLNEDVVGYVIPVTIYGISGIQDEIRTAQGDTLLT